MVNLFVRRNVSILQSATLIRDGTNRTEPVIAKTFLVGELIIYLSAAKKEKKRKISTSIEEEESSESEGEKKVKKKSKKKKDKKEKKAKKRYVHILCIYLFYHRFLFGIGV